MNDARPEAVVQAPPDPPGAARSAFPVGQVLPAGLGPSVKTLRLLADLVEHAVPEDAAQRLRDPRIPPDTWARTLAREIAMTVCWGARRAEIKVDSRSAPVPAWDGQRQVLVLLPAHAHAVHALRRALPFALCGVPTRVVGHEEDRRRIAEILAEIGSLTGVQAGHLEPSADLAPQAIRLLAPGDLVVVTGRPATARVVTQHSPARVLAATGGCTVLTGTDPRRLEQTAARLRQHDSPGSCTRLHGWWPVDGQAPPASAQSAPLSLADVHPSAVYRLGAPMDAPVGMAEGYTVLPCDESGTVGTLTGFARDPRYGWPGDFLA